MGAFARAEAGLVSTLVFLCLDALATPVRHTGAGCEQATRTRGEAALAAETTLHVTAYLPLVVGEISRVIYNGRTVRFGRLQGEDYPIVFSPEVEFVDGATDLDYEYLVRLKGDPRMGTFRSTFDRLQADSSLRKEMRKKVEFALDRYLAKKTVTPEEVEEFRNDREALPVRRTSFFEISDARDGSPKAIIGLLDGTRSPGMYCGLYGDAFGPGGAAGGGKIQIEDKFPHLVLPERRLYGDEAPIHELVRLAVSDDVIDGVAPILGLAASALQHKQGWMGVADPRAVVYALAPERHASLYERRYGFRPVFTPEEIDPEGKRKTKLVILKIPQAELFARYASRFYLPRLRAGLPRLAPF